MKSRPPTSCHPRFPRAFTLVELLVVIAVIGAITVAAKPAISYLATAGQFKENASRIARTFDLARETAMAKSTYTWVVFAPGTNASGPMVEVGFVESKTGVDPTGWSGTYAIPSPELVMAGPVVQLEQVRLEDIVGNVPNLPNATPEPLAKDVPAFSTTKGGRNIAFQRLIQFTPTGEARVGIGMSDYIGLELASTNRAQDIAYVVVNGFTGTNSTLWPAAQ